jgi:3-hydroxyacyl-[acyl-carrier-protein] dehydratase
MDYLSLLPHAWPMRLVEEIIEIVPGERCRARRLADARDFYFQGHFPNNPVVPASILVELIAQVGGLAAGSQHADSIAGPVQLRVAAIGPCKFPGAAGAGAVLEATARVVGRLGALYKIEGEVLADGRLIAAGAVTLAQVVES